VKEGKSQYGLAFRHKRVERCAISALAFYFFVRYHVQKESWPPFHDREQWYKTKLLAKAGRPYESLGFQGHTDGLNTAFEAANCLYLRGTRAGSKEGCKLADIKDVPDAEMRRIGRWDHSQISQHYSAGLPMRDARMLAEHGQKPGKIHLYVIAYAPGDYCLDRERLSPPDELQRQIFPLIEQTDAANQANGPDHQDIAQRSFMGLLRWFRIIILQDAVFLREKFPGSPLWNHYIFRLPQFEDFASRLKAEARYGDAMARVDQAVPDIAHLLREQHREIMMTLNTQFNSLRAEYSAQFNSLRDQYSAQFNTLRDQYRAQFSALHAELQPLRELATMLYSVVREAGGAIAAAAVAVQAPQALPVPPGHGYIQGAPEPMNPPSTALAASAATDDQIPKYRM
jgi:Centromere DNA-binding protein complex CBF3 subunit, domain 2